MSASTIRTTLFLIYMVGNALTYRHLVKADPEHALEAGTMLINLGISCVWPFYWVFAAIT